MAIAKVSILGVTVDNLSAFELKRRLLAILSERKAVQIVTPNPEFMLMAQENKEFFMVLREAHLAIPDGMGLKFAAWLNGINLKRHPGANLVSGLLNFAQAKRFRVAIINWNEGLSSNEDIKKAVQERYQGLDLYIEAVPRDVKKYDISRLRAFKPDLLFVALGAPEQDLFISRYRRSLPSLRLGMGVGGSFDFLTGKVRRAPKLMRALGLEWLWRVMVQPGGTHWRLWRLKRIWNAWIVFSWTAFIWRLRGFTYRPNVVALIVNDDNETLILNARGRGDYWGLPQGGIDKGESPEKAVLREVREETGLQNLRIIKRFDKIYQYTWSKPYTHSGHKGQRQTLFILRYSGSPEAVRTNPYEHKDFRWIKISDLLSEASAVHKKQYELFLEKYHSVDPTELKKN